MSDRTTPRTQPGARTMRVPRIQRTLENMSNRGRRQNHSPEASRSPRLQKLLADAGIASRRAAEKLILEGRVELNGRVVKELGTRADPRRDRILVDGKRVGRPRARRSYLVYKPRGTVTTTSDVNIATTF